jgi:hypothetical protein
MRFISAFCALFIFALPGHALAWGYLGHHMIGEVAMKNLPAEIPAFLRTESAAFQVSALSQEPDISRNAGQPHDWDADPGHFLDLSDDGTILGGPKLSALPPSRRDYDTALRTVHSDQYSAGFLPYNIMDGWQQLVKDFALLRAYRSALKYAGQFKLAAADRRDYAQLVFVIWAGGRISSRMPANRCMPAFITMAGARGQIRKALSPARACIPNSRLRSLQPISGKPMSPS